MEYSRCTCGAVTIFIDTGESYSCAEENRKKYMPGIDLRKARRLPETYCCDHCCNKWGLDLCACGCGEPVGQCANDFEDYNGQPMQILYGRTRVVGDDAMAQTLMGGLKYA